MKIPSRFQLLSEYWDGILKVNAKINLLFTIFVILLNDPFEIRMKYLLPRTAHLTKSVIKGFL